MTKDEKHIVAVKNGRKGGFAKRNYGRKPRSGVQMNEEDRIVFSLKSKKLKISTTMLFHIIAKNFVKKDPSLAHESWGKNIRIINGKRVEVKK